MLTEAMSHVPLWALLCAAAAVAIGVGAVVYANRRRKATANGALLAGALTALAVVYVALLAMNATAQMTWGRDTLKLEQPWDIGVPATLDGLAISVGLFAAWLVRMGRNPRRAWVVVWAATGTSSYISATEGSTHGSTAAVYLGVLAILVMGVFHLIVEQTHPEAGMSRHDGELHFGLRWITKAAGQNATILLWLDWTNSPPPAGRYPKPSVADAIEHRANVLTDRKNAAEAAVATAELQDEQRRIRHAASRRRIVDAENGDTIAELQAAVDEALAKIAEESARRFSAETEAASARAEVEEREADNARLRAALAEASVKPARKPSADPARNDSAQSPAEERTKDDRAKVALIRRAYTDHRKVTGDPMSRYAVEQFKPDGKTKWDVKSTQANRILAILDTEFAEANDEEREDLNA